VITCQHEIINTGEKPAKLIKLIFLNNFENEHDVLTYSGWIYVPPYFIRINKRTDPLRI
jgi:hypothetical protein